MDELNLADRFRLMSNTCYRHHVFEPQFFYPTFFVWIESSAALRDVLTIFNDTVLFCNQKVHRGVFHPNSKY